jgi:predicted pyridoxine 5'-phosphate oxidase superfamily flavin-nucleotide-binding protein
MDNYGYGMQIDEDRQQGNESPALDAETLGKAVELAGTVKYIFVATANEKGSPHLATAERITMEEGDLVLVTAWFCPQTASNVLINPAISLIVWDSGKDLGFQLVGEVEKVVEVTIQDGFIPGETVVYPQIERKLVVRVQNILNFGHAMHSDAEVP